MQKLEALPPKARLLFASFCAARLLPAIRQYLRSVSEPISINMFEEALELVWAFVLATTREDVRKAREIEGLILDHMPSEDDPQWTCIFAYAEDAMTSIVFALRAMYSGDLKEIFWAAQTAYEAVDQFVLDTMDVEIIGPREEQMVLQSSVVQLELERQERDLRNLAVVSLAGC